MYQISKILKQFRINIFILSVFCIFFNCTDVYAKAVTLYKYHDIWNALPEEYQSDEYIYEANEVGYICFATYNGNNYTTSIKKTAGVYDYMYCMDYAKTITPNKYFEQENTLFNNELRSRIGVALVYGALNWGELADTPFTTGNSILDYYMTQTVIHGIINKYGGEKAYYGIDMNQVVFKDNVDLLKEKTLKFYNYCCNVDVVFTDGHCQPVDFSFVQPESNLLYQYGNALYSNYINCTFNDNNAEVDYVARSIYCPNISEDNLVIETKNEHYASTFRMNATKSSVDKLSPGLYTIYLNEKIMFNRKIASFWRCSDAGFENSQELGCLITNQENVGDSIQFTLLIGRINLLKRDSLTGETIPNATFKIYQYNDNTLSYDYYKDMIYNEETGKYESGNLYINYSNKSAKFKLIEAQAGTNYINNWDGHEFTLTTSDYIHNVIVENDPILGKLQIHKAGEETTLSNGSFTNLDTISLSGITFGLYAAENIYKKGSLTYKQDQKIAELLTNSKGDAEIDNLLPGDYYIKELTTNEKYHLPSKKHYFSISRGTNRAYSVINLNITNQLKDCKITLYKYFNDVLNNSQKTPLANVEFGLYAKNNIYNLSGKCIVPKDTLIQSAFTDKNGTLQFSNLLYADYYMKELSAPNNFIKDATILYVSKSEFQYNTETIYEAPQINIENKQKHGKLEFHKYGEYIFLTEDGPTVDNKKVLNNITFSLYANSDIYLNDQIKYKKNSFISTLKTNSNGLISIQHLLPGDYYLEETFRNDYYIPYTDKFTFTIQHNKTTALNLTNKLKKCEISVYKYYNDYLSSDKQQPLAGVTFGLYAKEDIKDHNEKTIIAKDTLIDKQTTNQNGYLFFQNLYYSNYYLKELSHPDGFLKCDSSYNIKKENFRISSEGIYLSLIHI